MVPFLPSSSQGTALTGAKLAEASGVEESSSPHGVELEHKQDEGQTTEDERKHHEDLHRLQPACSTEERGVEVTAGADQVHLVGHHLPQAPALPVPNPQFRAIQLCILRSITLSTLIPVTVFPYPS